MTRSRAGACQPKSALGLVAAAGTRWLRRFWVGGLSLALWVTVLVPVEGGPPAAWAEDELFVTNVSTNSITVYARTASGNTAPLRTLQGVGTGLRGPEGVAVDLVNNELVVANSSNSSITVTAERQAATPPHSEPSRGRRRGWLSPSAWPWTS